MAEAPVLDLQDLSIFAKGYPHALFDRVREKSPVYWNRPSVSQPGFWVLLRHADVEQVSRDHAAFCSGKGFRLFSDTRLTLAPRIGQSLTRTVIAMDDPEHALYRRLLNPSFNVAALKRLEPAIAGFCEELFVSLRDRGEVEFVSEVAAVVPIRAICSLLGIPPEDEHLIFDWTNRMLGTDDTQIAPSIETANRAYEEVFDYGARLIAARKQAPRDDLLTVVAGIDTGDAEATRQIHEAFVAILIAAGNETTRNSFTGAMLALHDFPDQRDLLIRQPDAIEGAVRELLRYVSPVVQMMRTATRDTEIAGTPIAAGDRVVMLYPAANHDPAIFADPHRLDVARANLPRNLGFGVGIHHCLGARLATVELTCLIGALLRHFPEFAPISEPRYLQSNFVAGVKSVQVALGRPAARKAA